MAKRKTHRRKTKAKKVQKSLPQGAFNQAVLSWYSPQYIRFRRGLIWYVIAGLVNASLLGYAIWAGTWSMALVFALLPVVFLIEHRNKPEVVEVIVSQYGIKFGIFQVPFSDIKNFWILHDPPYVDELHILTNQRWHPEITIPLVGADPTVIRQYLVTQIPEWEGKKQSFIDVVTRIFKLN